MQFCYINLQTLGPNGSIRTVVQFLVFHRLNGVFSWKGIFSIYTVPDPLHITYTWQI